MGTIENRWRQSLTRRRALQGLAGALAGSSLLHAQQDPHPLTEHRRALGLNEMVTAFDFEPVFFANVPRVVFDYTAHGDGSEFTLRRNRDVFDWIDIVAGPAVNPSAVDTSTELLGLEMDVPMFIAPTGTQMGLHPDREMGLQRGGTAARVPLVIPSGPTFPIDQITSAANGPTWYQFYPRQDLKASQDALERAQAAGCRAVMVTVDRQAGYYERDLHNRNLGGASRAGEGPGRTPAPRNPYRVPEGRLWYTWEYMEAIRKLIKVPVLMKGIVTTEDALLCVERGWDGIIVSNHGGRSLDYGPSTLEVLPEIVDAVRGRIPVLVDGGFRRGSDVLKGLALGARAVLLGRVPRWALAAYGAPGVQRALEIIRAELVQAMATAGRSTIASLDRTAVRTHFS